MLFGLFIVGMNYASIVVNRRNVKNGIDKHHSMSPIIGPLFFVMGASFLNMKFSLLMIMVFVIDPGTWMIVLGLPYALVKGFFNRDSR